MKKGLIIGIGNSGKEDDGLGWAFLDQMEKILSPNFDLEYKYQLQVEDAELIAKYPLIFFIDADVREFEQGFSLSKITPKSSNSYTSHELAPETVLALCQKVYLKSPECFSFGISGKSFSLKIGLTDIGVKNLEKAKEYFILNIVKD